jgi:hypothetical protein
MRLLSRSLMKTFFIEFFRTNTGQPSPDSVWVIDVFYDDIFSGSQLFVLDLHENGFVLPLERHLEWYNSSGRLAVTTWDARPVHF